MSPIILINPEELKSLITAAVKAALSERSLPEGKASTEGPLSIEQAAAYLNISLSTLYRYTSQRLIPHHKPGKVIYFYREELDAWLQGSRKLTRKQIEEGAELPPQKSKNAALVIFKNNRRKAS